MIQVLHITTHMGGGVGKVLSGVCCYEEKQGSKYKHKIILLEKPEQDQFVKLARNSGVEILIEPEVKEIEKELKKADIVQIEWWHHPLMAKLLCELPEIPLRLIIWSHVSGCSYPVIKEKFVKNCTRFIFSSPYSLENVYLGSRESGLIENNTDVVFSSGGFENIRSKRSGASGRFNIGYLGTLNLCKLHPDFVGFCNSVKINDARFVMIGDSSTKEEIKFEARKAGIQDKFEFVGYTTDVAKELDRIDVLGYVLNPEHYGTTENALLEAMAAGIPPIVLNHCAEKYIVEHMETGILVNDMEGYGLAMRYLYERPDERARMGENARRKAIEAFEVKNTVNNLRRNYDVTLQKRKQVFSFAKVFGEIPAEWIVSCMGKEKDLFERSMHKPLYQDDILNLEREIAKCSRILKEKSKSSIYHFNRYFPEDEMLKYWIEVVEKYGEEGKDRI